MATRSSFTATTVSYNLVIAATDRSKPRLRFWDTATTTEGTADFKESAVAARSSHHREDARQPLWRLLRG